MHVVINPTFICNLHCEYCYLQTGVFREEKLSHSVPPSTHDYNDWLDGLLWLENEFGRIETVDISGGEPFLYPYIIKLINRIPERMWVGLTTNTFVAKDKIIEISTERRKRMNVVASLHLTDDLEINPAFVENVKYIRKAGFNVIVNFVAYKRQAHKIPEVRDICNKLGVFLHIEPHIDYSKRQFSLGEIGEEVLSALDTETRSNLSKIQERKIPSECWIGTSYLWVVPNGDIFQCLGYFLSGKSRIGNIFERKIDSKPSVPVMCDIFCPCAQNWR